MYGGRETGYNWSNPATWAICFGPLAIWARSAFFGIYVNEQRLKVVSWFWTYYLDRSTISRVSVVNYNGYVIMWSGGTDLYSANVSMIGFELQSGRERFFPATAMRYQRAKSAGAELRHELGLGPGPDVGSFRRSARRATGAI